MTVFFNIATVMFISCYTPTISSIILSSSSEKPVPSITFKFSRICCGFEAPTSTLVTSSSFTTHLRAICASVSPRFAAISFNFLICPTRSFQHHQDDRPDFHPPPYPSRHQRLPVQLRAGGADVHRDEGPPAGHPGAVRRLPGGKPRPHPGGGSAYAQTGHLKEMADWFAKYLKAEEEAQ